MLLLSSEGRSRLGGCDHQQMYSSSTHSEQGEGKDDRCTNHKPSPSPPPRPRTVETTTAFRLAFVDFYFKKVSVLQEKKLSREQVLCLDV
jgi:hypothetical protein